MNTSGHNGPVASRLQPSSEPTAPTDDEETTLLTPLVNHGDGSGHHGRRVPGPYSPSQLALDAANFFIADAASLGALAFIYCTSSIESGGLAMSTTAAGAILMVQGIFGVVAGPPLGWYIDRSPKKKQCLSAVCGVICATWLLLAMVRNHAVVAMLLSVQGLAGAVFPPGICGLSLGVVGYARFPERTARNEQWKHGGAVIGALTPIAIVRGNYTPLFVVFAGAMVAAIVSINSIRDRDIDHELASGLKKEGAAGAKAATAANDDEEAPTQLDGPPKSMDIKRFFMQRNVLIFLGMVVLWHFANAPMLPSVGYKIQQAYERDPDNAEQMIIFGRAYPLDGKNGISLATIVAHVVMIPVAKASGVLATMPRFGSRNTLTVATVMIVFRGVLFALVSDPWSLLGISFLDGLSAGAFGVLAVLMVGDLAVGSGRANVLQGAMAACIGMGGSLSNGIFGRVTEDSSVDTTFWWLAVFGAIAVALLLVAVQDLHDYDVTVPVDDDSSDHVEKATYYPSPHKQSGLSRRSSSGGAVVNPLFDRALTGEDDSTTINGSENKASRSLFPAADA